ncbi:unnamed protein product [Schistocephalus solidus]|uniref:Kinesin-like protein n=1 Tax=Schistocephalus solidus TaxID=70667 RepID=A0A183TCK3_SCHSO|nr:unnamed protein product [Schistocephalus solidus]
MSGVDNCLSFVLPRPPSFGLHPNFQFSELNKNLLEEFNEEHLPVYLRIRPTVASESGDKSSKILLLSNNNSQSPVVDFACKETVSFHFWISFAELYNETVYDLLDPDVASLVFSNTSTQRLKLIRKPLDLRMDSKGNVFIKGLRWYAVNSAEEALRLLLVGRKCQQMGATKLNSNSSRSHTIFCIKAMKMANREASRFVRVSSLTFCDLAGSERCNKAQTLNQALRFREANCINTSLLALGKCIEALRQNQRNVGNPRVVPYRDSKLTRLFQNFLTGRGKACMIVNIAPCRELCDETLHALRFSSLASQICVAAGASESAGLQVLGDGAPATSRIERELREQLVRQGLKARLTNAAKSRSGEWGDSTLTKVKVNDGTAFKRGTTCGSNSDPTADQRPSLLLDFLDEKVDLFRLPKSDLIDIVWELSTALLQAQKSIEDVRKEAKASIFASMSEELVRIEEQYEALLLEQEKNFERELAQTKSRRGLLDEDEEDEEDVANGCTSCAASEKEIELLKNELEEAKSDLADQQDAIANVSRQRDEFEVAVRRLEYNEEVPSTHLAPATATRSEASLLGVQVTEVKADEEDSKLEAAPKQEDSCQTSPRSPELPERHLSIPDTICPTVLQSIEISGPAILPEVSIPPLGPRSLKLRAKRSRKKTLAKPIPAPALIPELENSDAEVKFLEELTGTATTLSRLPSHVEDMLGTEDKENFEAPIPKRTRRKAHSSQTVAVTYERRITRARSRMISDTSFPSMATIKEI